MHLIQRMKIWKELKLLEERVREEPSPTTFVDLGQVYINLECYDKAARAAEDGLALFPKSAELGKLLDCARRGLARQRIAELETRLLRSPSPAVYRELAELQMNLGEMAALNTTCKEWSTRYPDDADAWLVQGQARLLGFYRDLAAREGQEAVRCLDRAVSMDADAPQARRLLGEVLYRVGAVDEALSHLEALGEQAAGDAELDALLSYVRSLDDQGGDVDRLLAAVEERGALSYPTHKSAGSARPGKTLARIRDALGRVAEFDGVSKATYIKGSRALVKGNIRDGRDPFLKVVRVVAKAAHRFGRRMDIGNACKSVVDGDYGHICVCVYGDALAGVECSEGSNVDVILAELQEIVAGSLTRAGGRV